MIRQVVRATARATPGLITASQISKCSPRVLKVSNFNLVKQNLLSNTFSTSSFRSLSDQAKQDTAQVEEKVLNIIRNFDRVKENPSKPQVSLESNLIKDLGLDSLDQVEIIVQLEDTFGYEIPDSDYEKLNTPAEIVNYIQKRLAEV